MKMLTVCRANLVKIANFAMLEKTLVRETLLGSILSLNGREPLGRCQLLPDQFSIALTNTIIK